MFAILATLLNEMCWIYPIMRFIAHIFWMGVLVSTHVCRQLSRFIFKSIEPENLNVLPSYIAQWQVYTDLITSFISSIIVDGPYEPDNSWFKRTLYTGYISQVYIFAILPKIHIREKNFSRIKTVLVSSPDLLAS